MSFKTRTHGFTAWVNFRLLQPGQPLLKNVLTDLLNGTNTLQLLTTYIVAAHRKIGNLDSLTSTQNRNQVQKLIRELKKNGVIPEASFVDSRLFAVRSADHVVGVLWRLVCHDIWFVWKKGATILQNENPDLLLVTPFTIVEEESKIRCRENPRECAERSPACLPTAQSCILEMVMTQLKMTSEGRRLNCRIAAEQLSGKMASVMKVRTKQRCVIEFINAEKKIVPIYIHRRLLNVYGDQTMDVSTVKRWIMRFSSGDSDTFSDLANSHVLCALLNAFVPETFNLEILINDRWTTNLVLRTMEDMFEISSPFNSEDLIEGDKVSLCAYFCFFFMVACRYRQCRAVTTQLESIKGAICMFECLIENTMEPTRKKTLERKYEFVEKIRNHAKSRKILEENFDPKTFSGWMQHVESIKKKTVNIVRQKMDEKFETVNVPRDITIAKLCQSTGINLSLTTGHGYYLCQTPEMVTKSRDIVLKDKATGKFICNNQKKKRKIRTTVGLWPLAGSQLVPSKYPEYEIYLESTSKNRQLPNGCTFLYQIFPSSDIHWKQRFIKAARENESDTVLRMALFFKADPDFINWKEPKSGNTALHYASRNGNTENVQRLLQYNAHFDCQNKSLCTPLHLAVTRRHRAIIHLLIEWGCDVSIKNDKQHTAIDSAKTLTLKHFIIETYNHYLLAMPAIMNGDSDLLLRLIKDHMNRKNLFCSLSSRCVSGSTLLHTAVHWGDTESTDYLLQLRVDPDIRDYKGATPLHRTRDSTSSAILLDAGAKIDAKDNDGNTPLHIKCYELEDESSNLEVISFLIERGADVTKRNKTGLLPIHCSAMRGRTDVIDYQLKMDTESRITHALTEERAVPSLMCLALTGGFLSCAHWLLENGFNLFEGEPEKLLCEIVCKSIKTSNTDDILSFLFDYGVDVNFQFQGDNTALHYVCYLGASEFTLKGLLERGASLEILNEKSMSPLMVAVKANNLKTAAILLQAGADMKAENDNGECALDVVQDPDDWIKSDQFPESIKETVTAHYWQEARKLIQKLTTKVRSESPNKPLPVGWYTNRSKHRGPLSPVQRLPSIFITSKH